jgi:hypothetical protein
LHLKLLLGLSANSLGIPDLMGSHPLIEEKKTYAQVKP